MVEPKVIWKGSPNVRTGRINPKTGKQMPILFIVDHISQGTASGADAWFANPAADASSHYLVCKNGDIHQYADEKDTAWTQGLSTNQNDGCYPFSNPVLKECGYINPNLVCVSIEHEGYTGQPLTDAQYNSSLWLHDQIINRYKIKIDEDHVIGHYRIDPVNRLACPGKAFPFDRLITQLKLLKHSPDDQRAVEFLLRLKAKGILSDVSLWNENLYSVRYLSQLLVKIDQNMIFKK